MGVLNAGEDTDRHNKVIQGGSRAYAGLVILFRIISTRNSLGVANVLCSPSRAAHPVYWQGGPRGSPP